MPQDKLVKTAEEILVQTLELSKQLKQRSIVLPSSLSVGANSDLWNTHDGEIKAVRSRILALTMQLDTLLEGPHGFLHEYVSTNWDHGALYALLEFDVMEKIPLDGTSVGFAQLAGEVGLEPEKLLRICRLVATAGILQETEEGFFAHTAISETLARDEGYKKFIGFQLFETRVASAHLADSLRKSNPFWNGESAFEHAWGMPMYDWHTKNPSKGKRFAQAMESVSQNLDPGNGMVIDWFTNHQSSNKDDRAALVVEVSGKTGSFSCQLAAIFPGLCFEVQDSSSELLQRGEKALVPKLVGRVRFSQRDLFAPRSIEEVDGEGGDRSLTPIVFLLRGVLWSLDDSKAIKLLQSFIPAMQRRERPLLVINDLVSPAWGSFEPHAERAFRRRDVTLMTMHNVKQRTASEWGILICSASPQFKVTYSERYSSHSCRGLWEVQLGDKGEKNANGDS
ncbi:putative O-methyltransferase [Leptodontidium sp. 2 PMI_412]|nr:putative O-methyltransferase [Leptodontidium sp. 2 PMI_412]